jgi:hypothetical protein
MTLHKLFLGVMLVVLTGCGKTESAKPEDKPGDKKGSDPTPAPTPSSSKKDDTVPTLPPTKGPSILAPNEDSQQHAERFIADLRIAVDAPAKMPDLLPRISPAFLKTIGKPLRSEADRKAGYSADAAAAWLRQAGTPLVGIGLPTGYGTKTEAVLTGSFGNGTGRFLIRMVFAEGWKVDWFSLGTLPAQPLAAASVDHAYQDFGVLAFMDSITANSNPKEVRIPLLAASIMPKLRDAWATPFGQDKDQGFDYNPGLLGQKAQDLAAGVTGFTRTAEGDTYKIELAKGAEKSNYKLKLTKGTSPGEWQVEEFVKQ